MMYFYIKNSLFFCTISLLLFSCSSYKSNSNNYEEYFYLPNGDSTLHVKCIGGETFDCWEYYINGQLNSHVTYNEDGLYEIHSVYDTTGVLLKFGDVKKGNGYATSFYENGQVKSSGSYKSGVRSGWWIDYDSKGDPRDSTLYTDGYAVGGNDTYPYGGY